jgi:hypothetical protein
VYCTLAHHPSSLSMSPTPAVPSPIIIVYVPAICIVIQSHCKVAIHIAGCLCHVAIHSDHHLCWVRSSALGRVVCVMLRRIALCRVVVYIATIHGVRCLCQVGSGCHPHCHQASALCCHPRATVSVICIGSHRVACIGLGEESEC